MIRQTKTANEATFSKNNGLSLSKEIACIAVMCALLIGGQFVFSFVAGIEIVTVLFICFCYSFGIRRGVICGIAFALLRCVLFGFYPSVIILYLIYYPLLAIAAGGLGKIKAEKLIIPLNLLLITVAVACALCYFYDVIRVARAYKMTVNILLWVICVLSLVLTCAYDCIFFARKRNAGALTVIAAAGMGAVMTALFTLLDDVITPLMFSFTPLAAAAYFYSSFTAMLPQIVCTIATVCTLFAPICAAMRNATKF